MRVAEKSPQRLCRGWDDNRIGWVRFIFAGERACGEDVGNLRNSAPLDGPKGSKLISE